MYFLLYCMGYILESSLLNNSKGKVMVKFSRYVHVGQGH